MFKMKAQKELQADETAKESLAHRLKESEAQKEFDEAY